MRTSLTLLLLLLTIRGWSQTAGIDRLRRALPTLEGRARADSLNAMGGAFTFYAVHADSALTYARLAYEQAVRTDYLKGQGVALLTQGDVAGRLLADYERMVRRSEQVIRLLNNNSGSLSPPADCSGPYGRSTTVLAVAARLHGRTGRPGRSGKSTQTKQIFNRNFAITTSGVEDPLALRFSIDKLGLDSVMWAIDYPYQPTTPAVSFIESARLTDEERAKVAHGNAERIFRISA